MPRPSRVGRLIRTARKPTAARRSAAPKKRAKPGPKARSAARKAPRAPSRGPRKASGKAPRRASGKPPRKAGTKAPARRRVVVRKPEVHEPAAVAADVGAFQVQLDKGARVLPLDPVTGRPGQTAAGQAGTPSAQRPGAPQARPASVPAAAAAAGAQPARGATGASAGLTYAGTGVDIHREDKAIAALAGMVTHKRTGFGAPLGTIGHFAGLVDFGPEHALVMCTDGVGSKVEIANALRKWDTVGIDCVAMNVNDCICVGAEPLAFVDYLAVQDPDPELTRQIGVGLNAGCRQADCSLIGGETASLPGIIKGFDLAGTCLGYVRRQAIVDGSLIQPGDVLIGLASTGIHSNGYSLARRAFESAGHKYTDPWPWAEDKAYAGKSIGEVLLEPTRIYVREVMALLRSGIEVHGLSHITGSGLRKLRRIHQGVRYDITDPLPVHPVFARIQQLGGVADAEMYKTFNMGMGFVIVVPKAQARKAITRLQGLVGYEVKAVGVVAQGEGVHHPAGGVH